MLVCVKYIVIIYNFIFWLLGVGLLGLSIYLYVDSNYYVESPDLNTPIFVLMGLGAIMTLVGFMGCCGAIRESTCLLGMYIFFCVSMGIACGVAVWWANDNESIIKANIKKELDNYIKQGYLKGRHGNVEMLVDKMQNDFQCCGVNGTIDWVTSKYQTNKSKVDVGTGSTGSNLESKNNGLFEVPTSCCARNYHEDCEKIRKAVQVENAAVKTVGINKDGCLKQLEKFIDEKWTVIIVVGIAAAIVQLFALIFALCLCCTLCCSDYRDK